MLWHLDLAMHHCSCSIADNALGVSYLASIALVSSFSCFHRALSVVLALHT